MVVYTGESVAENFPTWSWWLRGGHLAINLLLPCFLEDSLDSVHNPCVHRWKCGRPRWRIFCDESWHHWWAYRSHNTILLMNWQDTIIHWGSGRSCLPTVLMNCQDFSISVLLVCQSSYIRDQCMNCQTSFTDRTLYQSISRMLRLLEPSSDTSSELSLSYLLIDCEVY